MQTVLVYVDEGTGAFAASRLLRRLREELTPAVLVEVATAGTLRSATQWEDRCLALFVPGGADLPYCTLMNGTVNNRIRDWLEAGGRYFGICAGAYFASRFVQFEPGSSNAVVGPRELALFQGTASGSLHDLAAPYAIGTAECASVVSIEVYDQRHRAQSLAVYWGGPRFISDTDADDIDVLARYSSAASRDPAIVRCRVGHGLAVLSGVHPEFTGGDFREAMSELRGGTSDIVFDGVRQLESREDERRNLFRWFLKAGGLESTLI